MNVLLSTDSYKASHFLQYPKGAQYISSYIEARSTQNYTHSLFFGLQGFLMNLKPFNACDIDEADEFFKSHGLPFNKADWKEIYARYDGNLPLRIQALKEGSVVPVRTPLVQVVNTDPKFPWLTSYVETMLLRAVWYPTTVATRSAHIKNIIKGYLDQTCDDPASVLPFRLHDFGARGVSSGESAAVGGAAHLVNFMGSDTVEGIMYARKFYGEPMGGYSIPAAEHSTITAWEESGETAAYENMIDQFGDGLVAVVSDSYDITNAVNNIWGDTLKQKVLDMKGTLIVRPDSGDPSIVPINVVKALDEKFGSTPNAKGYKVLNPKVRVIQGDGISEETITVILQRLKDAGYSAENMAFGMGGQLLQALDRDTLGFAMKANAISIEGGGWRDVYKRPKTDAGKDSKRGRQAVVDVNGSLQVVREDKLWSGATNLLEPVWHNGHMLRRQNFSEIRELSNTIHN